MLILILILIYDIIYTLYIYTNIYIYIYIYVLTYAPYIIYMLSRPSSDRASGREGARRTNELIAVQSQSVIAPQELVNVSGFWNFDPRN